MADEAMLSTDDLYSTLLYKISELLGNSWLSSSFPEKALTLDHLEFLLKSWKSELDASQQKPPPTTSDDEQTLQSEVAERLNRSIGTLNALASRQMPVDAALLDLENNIQALNDLELKYHPARSPSPQTPEDARLSFDTSSVAQSSDMDPSARPDDNDEVEIVELLLEFEQTNLAYELLRASRLGHLRTMAYLLTLSSFDEVRDTRDENGRTAIHLAALHSHPETLRALFGHCRSAQQLDVFLRTSDEAGCTPLHLAASSGSNDSVRQLLHAGADRNIANSNGESALEIAVRKGHEPIVELLTAGTREASLCLAPLKLYSPLADSSSVRLLRMLPKKDRRDDSLEFEMVESRTYESTYSALSYTWGDTTEFHEIRVNGHVFHVSPNLRDALWALRRSALSATRLLWIDAICINQNDLDERSAQVAEMFSIFRDAAEVVIWLGQDDDSSRRAMSFIQEHSSQGLDLSSVDSSTWVSLSRLMSRKWFSRRWVIQEVLMARSASIHCGLDSVSWTDFATTVTQFSSFASSYEEFQYQLASKVAIEEDFGLLSQVSRLGASTLVDKISKIVRLRPDGGLEPLGDLNDLMIHLSDFVTSDGRDTVYAILGLAKETNPAFWHADQQYPKNPRARHLLLKAAGNFRKQPTFRWEIDYNASSIDWASLTMRRIRSSAPADALDLMLSPGVPVDKLHTPLPSWVPQRQEISWSPISSTDLVMRSRLNADSLVSRSGDTTQQLFRATGDKHLDMRSTRSRQRTSYSCLHVQGFVLDRIVSTYSPAVDGIVPSDWLGAIGWDDRKDALANDKWKMFCETLIGDKGLENDDPYFIMQKDMMFELGGMSGKDTDRKFPTTSENHQSSKARKRVQATILNRCLIQTATGRFGLVNRGARPGDAICILFGCSVPVVLHRQAKSEKDLAAESEAEYASLQERLQKAQRLCKEFVQKRRADGCAWPRKRQQPPEFCLIREDVWLAYMAIMCSTLLIWLRRLVPSAQIIFGSMVFSGLCLLLANELSIQKLRLVLSVVNRDLLAYISPFVWAPVGYLAGDLRTSVYPLAVVGIIIATISRIRFMFRRPWQSPPAVPKSDIRYLLDFPELKDWYTLVSESYIHGMMNGEAISWQTRHNIRIETFELR